MTYHRKARYNMDRYIDINFELYINNMLKIEF